MLQIDSSVPARIVFPMSVHGDGLCPRPKLAQSLQSSNHLLFAPHNAHQVLHHFLQIVLDLIWTLRAAGAIERFQGLPRSLFDSLLIDLSSAAFFAELRSEFSGAFAKYQEIR